ncbi:MAG: protein translocase subunit SecDF [Bacteroidetes bacterium GWF2_42_66]|nr:MAG: protein translocase subunit SecDF [Bacteroidetes bacterium GWA2_42_15]OFX99687.1 MAG: protein translocase subunit SecDF [Bacteroidetes bacterium GWE2_42_39]OFY39725.1 MAG: protein translocase subunit SecDF [Bacteroidetes bacterium GWF2_42_66]HBL74863.1 protein translocase subunit SecDF [Prolixibacteraceae bacterium]HCR88846.1 protein translocase subunit SecDF [Prolixibacteraceae bacterium]
MQNKGAIRLFAILLALVCVYQLAFTYVSNKVEKQAREYAKGNKMKELAYLDSISGETVYNLLGIRKYTYKEVKELEMNLGLDLKGGMNVTLEVSVVDLIKALSNYSKDPTFNAAIARAKEMQAKSQDDFVTLFGKAFNEIDPNAQLAAIFNTLELKEKVKYNSTNTEVLKVIRQETDAAIDNSFNIIRTRIDRFGVAQPNVQPLQTKGRILVELPGVDDPKRVRKLLQGTANLEFWETYENSEIYESMLAVNAKLKEIQDFKRKSDTPGEEASSAIEKTDSTKTEDSLLKELETETDSTGETNIEDLKKNFPLFAILNPSTTPQGQLYPGPVVGTAHAKDTATVNRYFKMEAVKALLPRNLALKWTSKAVDDAGNYFRLIAIKVSSRDGRAPLEGDVIVDARQDYEQYGSRPEVSMTMNSEGAKVWARLTKENINKSVAIVLDGYVRSYPTVNTEITGGRSSITGLETVEEALDLANILKSGKMPAPANIVQEQIVGPSLGKEAINSGMWSFILAFLLVLGYMVFFYSKHAGMAANTALLVNVFFMFGIMASMGAVLTLPGIAGIVLTLGMAVDANVLIYERIEEENLGGKGLKLAIADGYRHAYSAIIDGQVTTLLTGIVLYIFGAGPIKGFATTLIIGILTSLFTSIFISRLIFERRLAKNKPIIFTTRRTTQWLRTVSIDFLGKRKLFYMISGVIMFVCVASMVFKGFNYGIDFSGGRSYIVKFDQKVKVGEIGNALNAVFGETPEVKTIGDGNQVKITTKYKIDESTAEVDNEVETMLYKGLQQGNFIAKSVSFDTFISDYRRSSEKVGPTVSDDIQKDAVLAVLFSLVMIFVYVAIRFNKWQYGLGGLAALFHDAIVVLGAYSLFSGIMPFSMEVDQSFIAAILTVIGFSINDTVVIFDRIREYLHLYPKRKMEDNMNNAINNTMRRTFNTSMTVFVVLFAIFIFGGASMRGFIFALLVGTVAGVYSTVFIATPIAYDMQQKAIKKAAGKAIAEKK